MRPLRLACAAATATVALLLVPSGAVASYYLTQKQAEHYARGQLHYEAGYHYTVAVCHPQGLKKPRPGYVYHRWGCYWAAGDSRFSPSCRGVATVAGSSESNTYYWRVNFHTGKCPWGTR
jgi:hypothetical protein